ncbi:MAG TPA: CHAT domain-containing protein [Acidobacteriaceae bacterium]
MSLNGCHRNSPPAGEIEYKQAQRDLVRGNLLVAESEAQQATDHTAHASDELRWKLKILQAEINVLRGKNKEALALLADSPPRTLANGDVEVQREVYGGLAYFRLGQLALATQTLKKAQELCGLSNSAACGELLSIEGIIDFQSGDLEAAESKFRQSLQFARQRHDQFLEATSLLNLGWVALGMEHYDEALSWSNASSDVARAIDAQLILEKTLFNVGWAYHELGDFEKALTNLEQARVQAERLGATSDEVWLLNDSGAAQHDMGNLHMAEISYKKSLALAQSLHDRKGLFLADMNLALLLFEQKDFASAATECERALRLAEFGNDRSWQAWPLLLRGRLLAHQGRWKEAESIFLDLDRRSETPPSVRWQVENALASTYEGAQEASQAERWYRKSIETFERQRSSVKSDEYRLPFFTNGSSVYRDYAGFLITHHRQAEALAHMDLGRARTLEEDIGLAQTNPASSSRFVQPQSVAARLKATILFYALGPEKSYLWAVSPTSTQLFELPKETEIAEHVQHYQKAILRSEDSQRVQNADAVYLYQTLVAPAQKLLPKEGRVYIIPDGGLNGFNFETLLVPASGSPHFWIEDAMITTASSLRMLATAPMHAAARGPQKLLLIGDPVSPSADYPTLTNASLEITDIERHFPAGQRVALTRTEAVPAAYPASRPGEYAFIHFVSHGTASRLSPLDSAVVLSAPRDRPEEFKLYAREIAKQPLHAQLVTISSCYGSGTRVYAGEGIVGLSWAFLRAGSQNVIGSLWEVSDASTPVLMDQMYGELERGSSPAAALRAAKLSLLHSQGTFRKPFYWAAFELYAGAFSSES